MTSPRAKTCNKCKIEKSIREFVVYRKSEDGYNYELNCKSCDQTKVCLNCNERKNFASFRGRKHKNGKIYYESICNGCESLNNKFRSKKRYEEKGRKEHQEKYTNPKYREEKSEYNRQYYIDNRERLLSYREARRDKDIKNLRIWQKEREAIDPVFKLRRRISNSIKSILKKNRASKEGKSILNYLPYTLEELRAHIESQFEPWMNWDNHGKYISDQWDDNDPSTWTWQIDHIIPHSDLPYDSMEHPNFKKCWALDNLRPYSAKQNVIDGVTKTRHR